MRFYLDSNDWEADYFVSHEDYVRWRNNGRRIQNMYLDSALTSGFLDENNLARASFRGTVPGCDRSMLLENGVIAEPFYDRNMDHSRWSENFSWGFRRRFSIPAEMRGKQRFQIHFCGIDYQANFFLNGVYLGQHTGMFIPFEADVTDSIRNEDNLLVVIFDPVPKASPDHTDPFSPKPAEFAEYHRAQMSYGWDWMRGMVAAGIWDHVYLNANDEVRVTDFFFHTDRSGKVELSLDTIAQKKDSYQLQIDVAPVGFEAQSYSFEFMIELQPGDNQSTLNFTCPEPELWYPNGYGEQRLYRLTLTLGGEVTTRMVAFRTLQMCRNLNSPDRAYNQTFTFNDVPVFARGVNWVPADLMHCRSGAAEYERLVRLAAEAGINLFRIWGGGIVEKEEFYDACDRYGIIVWQEFMHSCSSYRKDAEFLAFKKREGEAILRKTRNHVSVSLFCGGNEVQYYGEIPDSPLFIQYRELVHKLAPDRPFRTSCPDLSVPGERNHGPWHFMAHAKINPHDRLLASELGCNGFPELESIKRFIPEHDLDNPESQSWKYHFAIPCRDQDWRVPLQYFEANDPWRRSQASMFAQSDIVGYWMNHCRRKFPHTSGCFIWQYNEPWPTLALSLVDYYTLPKIAYYRLMRIQKSNVLSLRDENWCCENGKFAAELFLTSDLGAERLTASFRLLTMDGTCIFNKEYRGDFAFGTVKLDDLAVAIPPDVPGGVVLAELKLAQDKKEIFEDTILFGVPDYKKVFDAPKAEIKVTAELTDETEKLLRVTVAAGDNAAINLRLKILNCPHELVYWRNNYLTIPAGGCRTIEAAFSSQTPMIRELEVSAWNTDTRVIPITGK